MAIKFLNNANIPEATLTNANMKLISRAENATQMKRINNRCQFLSMVRKF